MVKDEFLNVVRAEAKTALTNEEEAFVGSFGKAVEKAFGEETAERKKALESVEAVIGKFDEGETAASVIRKVAAKVDELESNAKRSLSSSDKFHLRKLMEGKKEEITRALKSNNAWDLEFKAVRAASAAMTSSTLVTGATANNNPNVFDDTELTIIKYPENFIVDAIGGRQVPKVPETWRWQEQSAESVSEIGIVLEGGEKKLTDKSFAWKSVDRDKYAGRIEFTAELQMDFDQLLIEVIHMFEQQVIRKWNAGVQDAIFAWSPAYTSTSLDGFFVAPGVAQVIQAGKLHIADDNYAADMIILNAVDAAKAMIHQNANGDITYIPEAIAFSGLKPFISNNVPAGTMYIGTSGTVQEQHSSFIMRRGMYGEQFIKNQETIIGELYSVLKLTVLSSISWVKVVNATVIDSLTKVEEA